MYLLEQMVKSYHQCDEQTKSLIKLKCLAYLDANWGEKQDIYDSIMSDVYPFLENNLDGILN